MIPMPVRRVEHLQPGVVIVLFGALARVVGSDPCPAFPTALSLRMRPAAGGPEVVALVPVDFYPLVVVAVGREREHLPNRPAWVCWACELPWPCEPARNELVDAYDAVALATLAGERLAEAAHDLPTVAPEELFQRFVAWTWSM